MVYKEEICNWFKNLSPHKRIDYMCGMLQMCLPMELRFLGSHVEDLAKKDFHQLRESEGKANNRHELAKLRESDGRVFRTKMAVYLALLHSSNRTCSNIIFGLLENHVQEALTVIDSMDVMTVHNILLVLSMAMNHPAFSYHQKSRMYEYYLAANEASERILQKTFQEPELSILSESCDMRSCDQRLSPMCSPGLPQMRLIPSPVTTALPQHVNTPPIHDKVYVSEIDVKGSRLRDNGKNIVEYVIQVTWSNGEKKDVFKTYQELVEFHKKLMSTFPEEIMSLKLPSVKGTQNHKIENKELLNQYVSSLLELPDHIQHNDCFTSFFEATLHRPMADACTSPRPPILAAVPVVQQLPNSGDEETVIDQQFVGQPPSQNLYTSYLPRSPITGDMGNLSPHSPVHHELAFQASTHSPSCSTKTTSPRISSPCHSHASSMESLANSGPGSPASHDREDSSHKTNSKEGNSQIDIADRGHQNLERLGSDCQNGIPLDTEVISKTINELSVPSLLKLHNLAPYAELFVDYTLEQAVALRNEDIEVLGVPKEVVIVIKDVLLGKLREKQPPYPNGMIEPPQAPTAMILQPTYHIPALSGLAPLQTLPYQPAPPGPYQVFSYQSFQDGPGMRPGAQDMSPTNSEYSSPSPSPHLSNTAAVRKPPLHLTLTDSSSEDGERDKQPGQYRGNVRVKGHSAPNSARGTRYEKSTDCNSSSGTPPLVTEKMDSNVNNAGSSGNSGYTSDPTSTRPLLRTYKAQPAHTNNLPSHSKVVVNMPESNYKSQAQPFMQMIGPHQMRDINSSGHQGYNMNPAELGHRPMVYFPQGQAVFARSHFNPVNVTGSRPVFHPAAAVNQSLVQQAVINGNLPTGSNGKAVAGLQTVVPPAPLTVSLAGKSGNLIVNGLDSIPGRQTPTSDSCTLRASSATVSAASSTSSTVTYTGNTPSATPSRTGLCTSCGCNGQHPVPHPTIPIMPPIHANMWHSPYNGFVPLHMQHLYTHHLSYPNGLNSDLIYNPTMYGMSHSSSGGVADVPNVIYDNYSAHSASSVGGYSQKKPKKLNCHNCGSSKHLAADCSKVSMDAMSGHMMYSYKPKNESD